VPQQPIEVSGIWLRLNDDDNRIEVLAEVDGDWRLVITEYNGGLFSHIVEPLGIRSAPYDSWTVKGEEE
jgi:hypothetical protein